MIKCKITSQSFQTYHLIQLLAGSDNERAKNLEPVPCLDFLLAFYLIWVFEKALR